jgi:hypothetical protein
MVLLPKPKNGRKFIMKNKRSKSGLNWGEYIADIAMEDRYTEIPFPEATKIRYTVNTFFVREPNGSHKIWTSGWLGELNEEGKANGDPYPWVYYEKGIEKQSTYCDLMFAVEEMMLSVKDCQHRIMHIGSYVPDELDETVLDVHISS